jgi:DNA-binding NarL/FixJ family response regulator
MCAAPLQALQSSVAPESAASALGSDLAIETVLFEDQHSVQSAVADMLRAVGEFRVIATVSTEAEGLAWAEQNAGKWKLAVIDLVLSQGNGISLISRAKKTNPNGRIVVFSGFVSPGIRKHCLRLGADAAFDKSDLPGFMSYCRQVATWFRSGGKPPVAG